MVDSRKVQDEFHSGHVYYSFAHNGLLTFFLKSVYVVIGIWALYHAHHVTIMVEKVVGYVLLLFALWRLYRQGAPLLFLCERGIVIRRRSVTPKDYVDAFWNDDGLYVFVSYDRIVGFAEQWEFIHIGAPEAGGVYVLPVDLQYLNWKDKEFIIKYVEERQHDVAH